MPPLGKSPSARVIAALEADRVLETVNLSR
jgi:hypothetical protein